MINEMTGVTWDDYEKLNIPQYSSCLISFLNKEITIISPGRNHVGMGIQKT